jgi:hypothetical protein
MTRLSADLSSVGRFSTKRYTDFIGEFRLRPDFGFAGDYDVVKEFIFMRHILAFDHTKLANNWY